MTYRSWARTTASLIWREWLSWGKKHLADRLLLTAASFIGAVLATLWLAPERQALAVRVGGATALFSLVVLVLARLAIIAWGAPSRARQAKTTDGSGPILTIRFVAKGKPLDQLQHDALYLLGKVAEYEPYRKILGHGPVNDQHADEALSKVVKELESFRKRATSLGPDVVSRRGRREALRLHQDLHPITHDTDLEALRACVLEFAKRRPRLRDRLTRASSRGSGAG